MARTSGIARRQFVKIIPTGLAAGAVGPKLQAVGPSEPSAGDMCEALSRAGYVRAFCEIMAPCVADVLERRAK